MILHFAEVVINGGKQRLTSMPLRFTLLIVASLSVTIARAQWTKSDSPKINSLLKDKKEIKINRNEINNIQFDNRIINKPLRPERSNNLKFDETLPDIGKDKFNFTLRPYKPYTPFNRDPYFRCKIVHVGGIWIPIKAPKQYTEYLQAKRMSNDLFAQLTHTVEPDSVDILFGHTTPSNGATRGLESLSPVASTSPTFTLEPDLTVIVRPSRGIRSTRPLSGVT